MHTILRLTFAALISTGCAAAVSPGAEPVELCPLNGAVADVLDDAALSADVDYSIGCSPDAVEVGYFEAGDCRPSDATGGLWGDAEVCVSIVRQPGQPFPPLTTRVSEALGAYLATSE